MNSPHNPPNHPPQRCHPGRGRRRRIIPGAAALILGLLVGCGGSVPPPPAPNVCAGLAQCPQDREGNVIKPACNCCHKGEVVSCTSTDEVTE